MTQSPSHFHTLLAAALLTLSIPPSLLALYLITRKPPSSAKWVAEAERTGGFRPPHLFALKDGRLLAYNEYGPDNASRTIVFIHGAPGCRLPPVPDFEAACLTHNVKVVIVDRPGFGLSTADPAGTPSSFADDLEFFLGELHGTFRKSTAEERELVRAGSRSLADYSVEVVGFSLGSPYAIVYATKYPDRVEKLVLLAPSGFYSPPENAIKGLPFTMRLCHWLVANKLGSILELLWQLGASSVTNPNSYLFHRLLNSIRAPQAVSFDTSKLHDLWARRIAESTRQGIQAPMRDSLLAFGTIQGQEEKKWGVKAGPLACPLAIVHGSRDEFVTRVQAKHLFQVLAGKRAELVDLEGATHFGVLDAAYWLLPEVIPLGRREIRLILRREG